MQAYGQILLSLALPLWLSGCGGDPPSQGKWYTTCGDPVCRGYTPPAGVPRCTTQMEGEVCGKLGDTCDPRSDCNQLLRCAATDPKMSPGGCPISRRSYKEDIRYVSDEELSGYHDELTKMRLATYRYKAVDKGRRHLGFIIEESEPSLCIDGERGMVDLYGYTSMAVAALKVQARQIEALTKEVSALREQVRATSGKRRR